MLADRPHGRRLTADEQRQLDDLERLLLSGTPASARAERIGGATMARRPIDRLIMLVGVVVAGLLLGLATVVGGLAGLAATAATLLATLVVYWLPRLRSRR